MAHWNDFDYGEDSETRSARRKAQVEALLGPSAAAPPPTTPVIEGSRLLRKNRYLAGTTLSSVGGENGREDIGGKHDMTLHRANEHPRLEVMTKIYADRIERTYLVDGEPIGELGRAAAVLAEREAKGGIYPRPVFYVGDEARGPAGGDD